MFSIKVSAGKKFLFAPGITTGLKPSRSPRLFMNPVSDKRYNAGSAGLCGLSAQTARCAAPLTFINAWNRRCCAPPVEELRPPGQ